jgi:phosphatidylglycerol:prolipoprotein diacylglycerol transferase
MFPDTLHVGPIPIHLFGILLALAFLAAGSLASRELARKGWPGDLGSTMLVWAAVGGIVGARLWEAVEYWPSFVADPVAFLLAGAGFTFYGGLLGGAVAVSVVFRRHGIPWWKGADALAPAIVMGQAIGRIGCQLSGDGDWGVATTVPWGVQYPYAVTCSVPPAHCGPDGATVWPADVFVHPTPVYETLAYLAVFAVLWRLRTRPAPDGTVFAWYLILASTARLVIEFWRLNPHVAFGLSSAQCTSLVLVAVGLLRLVQGQRAWRPAAA